MTSSYMGAKVAMNDTTIEPFDLYYRPVAASCTALRLIGVYLLLLFVASAVFNSILLFVFIRHKEYKNSLNLYLCALVGLNLFGTITELPFIIISNLACDWVFYKFGCIGSAYLMYFVGCTSIYLIAAISVERFYVIYKPMSIRSIAAKTNMIVILLCALNGLFWATLPLLGWSHYSLEGANTSCSVEWKERTRSVMSYNITIFVVVFLTPLCVIVFTNVKLILLIRSMPNKIQPSTDAKARKRMKNERNLTIIIVLVVFIFILAWTPYAGVSMYSAFISSDVPPLLGTLPAVFAKSSMFWTSFIYILSNAKIKNYILQILKLQDPQAQGVGEDQDKNRNGNNHISYVSSVAQNL